MNDLCVCFSVFVCLCGFVNVNEPSQVYLQQNKKKEEDKGKNCHPKTMWSLEKAI